MRTLIIHPRDPTTEFLTAIYTLLKDRTVITGGTKKSEVRELILSHDRILILGHGTPYGLMSVGQFPDEGIYIIDQSMVSTLKKKPKSIFIWCHADQFVVRNELSGFCSGMFISEVHEAEYYGFYDVGQDVIDESNERFSSVVSRYMDKTNSELYGKIKLEYGILTKTNPIAKFNWERLYLNRPEYIISHSRIVF